MTVWQSGTDAYLIYHRNSILDLRIIQLDADYYDVTGAGTTIAANEESPVVFDRGDYLYCISGSPNYYDSTSTYNIKISYTLKSTPLSGWSNSCLLYRTDPVGGDRNGQPTAMLKINGADKYVLLGDYWTGGASSSQEGSRYTHARLRWVNEAGFELSTDASFDLADVGSDDLTVAGNDLLVDLANAWMCNEAASAAMVDAISANNLTATGTGAVRGIHFGGRGTFGATEPAVASHANLVINGNESHSWCGWIKAPAGGWSGFPFFFGKGDEYGCFYYAALDETWFYVSHDGTSGNRVFAKWLTALTPGNWYFYACTHDADNDLLSIRIGAHDVTGGTTLGARQTTAHSVGGYASGTTAFSVGDEINLDAMSDLYHWKGRALTAAEEATIYNGGAGVGVEDLAEEIESSVFCAFSSPWLIGARE
jgi:hypothetical protein